MFSRASCGSLSWSVRAPRSAGKTVLSIVFLGMRDDGEMWPPDAAFPRVGKASEGSLGDDCVPFSFVRIRSWIPHCTKRVVLVRKIAE